MADAVFTKTLGEMNVRHARAFDSLVGQIARCGKIDEASATKVAKLYLKEKLAKIDLYNGTANVKHGAFLDKEVIGRALAAA